MPDFNSLLVFIGAGLLLNITPGPDVLYIVGRSIGQGRVAGLVSVLGISTGCLVHVASAAGDARVWDRYLDAKVIFLRGADGRITGFVD